MDGGYEGDHLFEPVTLELLGEVQIPRFTAGAKLKYPVFSTVAWHNFQHGDQLS